MPRALPALDLSRIPPNSTTRFAPAPTGYLHLGHLVSAIYVWGVGRRVGARVLLRIEDHDRGRSRPEYESALIDDLQWLRLEADPDATGERSPLRQSERAGLYSAQLDALAQHHLVYGCCCSRRDIAEEVGDTPGQESRYPGTCRDLGLAWQDSGKGLGTRVLLEPGGERFDDLLLGPMEQDPAQQCGDLLVRDRLGQWTYQFAVTVDDWDQGIDLVIRGADLLESTGRQIRLARLLGRVSPPLFLHHPLVLKPSGEKLSKANRDTGVRELREAGLTADELLGEAAFRGGLVGSARSISAADLPELFE